MKRILFILSFLLIWINVQSQSLIIVGMTKVEVADSVNANLIELMDYKDVTLKTHFDTLSDTHGSIQLVGLTEPLDSLALLYNTTFTDSLEYGQRGARFRLAINTMFQELYEIYDYVITPLVGTITGNDTVCMSTPSTVTFSGSGGIPPYHFIYETTHSGNLDTVVTTSGTSINVEFPNLTAGNLEYALNSMYDEGTIVKQDSQTDTIIIKVNPLPTATISGTNTVTQGAASPNITFTGANATQPYSFVYRINGGAVQGITTTSGNSVTVAVPTSNLGTFIYTLVSVQDGSTLTCNQAQSGSATITVESSGLALTIDQTDITIDQTDITIDQTLK